MKQEQARRLLSQAIILGAVCIGAPVFVVAPLKARLARMEQSLATAQREAASIADIMSAGERQTLDPDAAGRISAWIGEMNSISGDAATVYDRIMTLGAEHGVRIDRMQPVRVTAARPTAGRSSPAAQTLGFTIAAIGEYDSIAAFIEAIERGAGFSAVGSVRLIPVVADGAQLVQATIETRHRRFASSADQIIANVQESTQ